MYDENQTYVPESFCALYLDARGRLIITKTELAQRSEFCEDLAQLTSDPCSTVHFRDGVDEATVLARCLAGLRQAASGVSAPEAHWVTRRVAELLGWEWPIHLDAAADA